MEPDKIVLNVQDDVADDHGEPSLVGALPDQQGQAQNAAGANQVLFLKALFAVILVNTLKFKPSLRYRLGFLAAHSHVAAV